MIVLAFVRRDGPVAHAQHLRSSCQERHSPLVSSPFPSTWMVRCRNTPRRIDMPITSVKALDSEKITINLGLVDLGHVDLLVQEGFYSNRTDFIRTAIRNQLATHAEALRQAVVRKTLALGLVEYTRADLEAVKRSGKKLRIQVLGL